MQELASQRCFNHATREAAVRCLSCHRFFCRECVTEHDDRLVCTSCLERLTQGKTARRNMFSSVLLGIGCLAGCVAAWFFFYTIGEALLRAPSTFHQESLWRTSWTDRE